MLVADANWGGERVRLLAIVPDPQNRFPRARHGELGLDEGWALAHHVRDAIAADQSGAKRPIIAIVDVQSQAYGRIEALLGIHLSLAAAADAYATARMAGHPVVALIVGTALSGGLLAHGDQAHRLLALDDPGVIIQAMRKQSAARVTRRTVEELDELGKTVIPMAYDIRQFAKLGLLHELITGIDADAPSAAQIAQVKERVAAAIADIRKQSRRSDQPAEQRRGEGRCAGVPLYPPARGRQRGQRRPHLGKDSVSDSEVVVKAGRFGPYIQLGEPKDYAEGEKPKRAGIPKNMSPGDIELDLGAETAVAATRNRQASRDRRADHGRPRPFRPVRAPREDLCQPRGRR